MKLRKRLTVSLQLRKAADQAAQYTNDDPEADARLEKEAKDEEKAIRRVCDELGLVLYEVGLTNKEMMYSCSLPKTGQSGWSLSLCCHRRSTSSVRRHTTYRGALWYYPPHSLEVHLQPPR